MLVRELLVLEICCIHGLLTDIGFERALDLAFGMQVGPELRSQCHLVRSSICRMGANNVLFLDRGRNIFHCTDLRFDDATFASLFEAYEHCHEWRWSPLVRDRNIDPCQ